MARVYQSGFESNTASEFHSTSGSPTIQSTVKRTGGYAGQITSLSSGTPQWFRISNSDVSSKKYYRIYFRVDTLPSSDNTIIQLTNASSTFIYLTINSSGALLLYDEDGQIGSASSNLSTSTWYRIEIKIDRSGSAGSHIVEGKIDGTVFATDSARDVSGIPTLMKIGGNLNSEANTSGNWYFDDIAINNNSETKQIDYPGAGAIIHIQPDSAGDNTAWTRGGSDSGANWSQVEETTPNDATDYNSSATLGEKDDHNLASSGLADTDAINVVAVGGKYRGRGSSANSSFRFRIKDRSGGSVNVSGGITPSSAWTYRVGQLLQYTKPSGGQWTATDLGSAQVGYEITTSNTNADDISTVWLSVDYEAGAGTTTSTSTSTTTSSSTTTSTTTTSTSTTSTSTSTSTTSTSSSTSTTTTTSTSTSTTVSITTSTSTTSTSSSTSTTTTSTSTSRTTSTSTSTSTTSTSSSTSTTTTTSTSTSTTVSYTTSTSTTTSTSSSTSSSTTTTSTSTTSTSTTIVLRFSVEKPEQEDILI